MSSDSRSPNRSAEALRHVAWVRDLDEDRISHLSATVGEFVGTDPRAGLGWDALMAAVHPADAARFGATSDAAFEFRYRRCGELRWAAAKLVRAGARLDGIIVDITDRVRAEEATTADRRRADALIAVASKISERTELPEIARVLCAAMRDSFGPHLRASFLLYESDARSYRVVYSEGGDEACPLPPIVPYAGVPYPERLQPERVKYAPVAALTEDAADADRHRVRGFAVAYLVSGSAFHGALSLSSCSGPLVLEPADLDLLRGMADQAASAVSNAQVLTESRLLAQRYRSILDTVFDGINITGFDGVIRYSNHQFAAMLGSTPEAVVGLSMSDLIFPEDAEKAEERIRRRRAGYSFPFTWRLRSLDDGHEVMVRANSREIKDEHGNPEAMLGVITDITSTRRIVERLLQSQKLESLGVLAGGIAHDFNNLLVGILGNAGLTLMELPPSSPLRPFVSDIQTAALRAADLTRQLLAYSGRGRFVLTSIDLGRLVEDMAQVLPTAVARGVTLTLRLAPGLPLIEGDAAQIRRVLTSLINNASDAIGDRGGEVTVATSVVHADASFLADTFVDDDLPSGDYVCLEVADTGAGMTPETAARIFDPFYTTKFVGRGLGLAAVLGILRGHKGAIQVESELGRGTTLRAFFPVGAKPSAAPVRRPARARAKASGTILVIDDEEGVRFLARRIFERAGFTVLLACDGVEGVERFREHQGEIAAVLLDVTMPRMGGEETFLELRRIRGDVRVLLSSGYSGQEAMSRFAGMGLAGFVEKPFCPQSLLDKLHAVLAD
ncbi:MAG: PAS domain S-box protein [Myxococcaceae bacterium]|nr:MAG: PAS domain S-box protein [Myxococcaceae bacterium]